MIYLVLLFIIVWLGCDGVMWLWEVTQLVLKLLYTCALVGLCGGRGGEWVALLFVDRKNILITFSRSL